jgi:hypothetical protein
MTTTAKELLTEFGQSVTITKQTAGSYDPATGAATVTTSTQTATGALFDYKTHQIDNTLILMGDRRLILSAVGITAPQIDDTVTANGKTYTIKAISETNPAGTVVIYTCNVRL